MLGSLREQRRKGLVNEEGTGDARVEGFAVIHFTNVA
jgi:hypothetical protein